MGYELIELKPPWSWRDRLPADTLIISDFYYLQKLLPPEFDHKESGERRQRMVSILTTPRPHRHKNLSADHKTPQNNK